MSSKFLSTYLDSIKEVTIVCNISITFFRGMKMEKISYFYLIEELGFTPEQIREIVHEAQKDLGKSLMMVDGVLLEKRQFAEGGFEAFLPCKVQFELELESNYFSTTLSNFAVNQLIYQLN
jgi:hypothetical protein